MKLVVNSRINKMDVDRIRSRVICEACGAGQLQGVTACCNQVHSRSNYESSAKRRPEKQHNGGVAIPYSFWGFINSTKILLNIMRVKDVFQKHNLNSHDQ